MLHCVNAGDVLSGYSATRIRDDMSYYDERPHVIVEDRYSVEPAPHADAFYTSEPQTYYSPRY